VEVVAISIDAARASSKAKAYVKARKYEFTTLLDKDTSVVAQYNPSKAIPYTVIIDRQGRIVHIHTGYIAGEEAIYISLIEEMLENESR
jgi:peroxiredoxin